MRHMGIDYGTKRIGVALSDEEGRLAFPHSVLENNKDMLTEVATLLRAQNIKRVVIGESRDLKGQKNPLMREIEKFTEALASRGEVEIVFEPEFMTSAQAARPPAKMPRSRSPKRREVVDTSAATLILQSYLDRMKKP